MKRYMKIYINGELHRTYTPDAFYYPYELSHGGMHEIANYLGDLNKLKSFVVEGLVDKYALSFFVNNLINGDYIDIKIELKNKKRKSRKKEIYAAFDKRFSSIEIYQHFMGVEPFLF